MSLEEAPKVAQADAPVATKPNDAAAGQYVSAAFKSVQLDVPLVDDYLVSLLLPRLVSSLRHVSSNAGLEKIGLSALLRAATLWYALLQSPGQQTPAMKAMGVHLTSSSTSLGNNESQSRTMAVATLVGVSVVLPALYQWITISCRQEEDQTDRHTHTATTTSTHESMEAMGRRRRHALVRHVQYLVERMVPLVRLAQYVTFFMYSPKTATAATATALAVAPQVALQLANLRFVSSSSVQRIPSSIIHYSYAHRRLLYDELHRLVSYLSLLHIVPPFFNSANPTSNPPSTSSLHRPSRLTQMAKRVYERLFWKSNIAENDESNGEDERNGLACVACQQRNENHKELCRIPYRVSPCGHVYCYICLRQCVMGDQIQCLKCGVHIQTSKRVSSPSDIAAISRRQR
uniref:RING-type domain-containing protein n=1 Tax=Attheya septentrionalis TaxID=420275 RepID=A0A7S2U949_9STRA|mmetsp:Transcript_1573/g.2817  ORF Transcript_1573/g.2817 Transcript_1573/m.2817 type:complete len:403 (+) Transcript_1573:182-1390(+)